MNNKQAVFLFLCCISALNADRSVTPTIAARSQGRDVTKQMVGVSNKLHQQDMYNYYLFSITPEYTRTFRDNRIAECLFGDDLFCNDCGNSIKIQGTDVVDRDAKAWLADYFYLPPDYDAQFSVKPQIQNILVGLDFYAGLDDWMDGMYFRLYGPVTWTRWDLNFCDACDVITSHSFRAGYFSSDAMDKSWNLMADTTSAPLDTFGQFAQGQAPIATSGTFTQPNRGVTFQGLKYAKMERCARDRTGFADLRIELGRTFVQKDNYQVGIAFQLAAPTGNKRNAEFVFDPTVGNGNHWEVGGVLYGDYILWRSEDEDKHLGIYLNANITHLVTACEQRTFDLCNKPNSRYMIAEKLHRPINYLSAGTTSATILATATAPIAQFAGMFAPVANLTTVNVNVGAAVQADIVLMANYTCRSWEWDLGYNFWARSCEHISLPARPTNDYCVNLCTGDKDVWALKGDAQVYGFVASNDGSHLSKGSAVALSATQCGATIHKGTNADADVADCTGIDSLQNCGVDNAQFAYGDTNHVRLIHTPLQADAASNHIKTSLEPKFINCCDINFQRTRGISHKLFTHLSYTWDSSSWTPFFGAGASVEFGQRSSDDCCKSTVLDCNSSCSTSSCCNVCSGDCLDCALSQWAVWVKGGITFD